MGLSQMLSLLQMLGFRKASKKHGWGVTLLAIWAYCKVLLGGSSSLGLSVGL